MGKNTVLQGAIILTASSILIRLLGFGYRILLSRKIGPEGMGLLQLIMPILFTSLALVSAGIPLAVSRLIAQKRAINDNHGIRKILFTALVMVGSFAFLICVILILNINRITFFILKEPRVRGALLALYPAIIIMSISAVFKGYFYGMKNFYPPALSELVEEIIIIVLALYLLDKVSHLDIDIQITAITIAMVLGELSSLLYLNCSYCKSYKKLRLSSTMPKSRLPFADILKISGPVALVRLISSLSTSTGSILIPRRLVKSGLNHSQAMAYLGILNGMVIPLIFMPFTFVGSLAVVMIPNLSEDLARKNWNGIRSKVSKSIFITNITTLPFGAFMAALAHPLGILLYGREEVGALLKPMAFFASIGGLSHALNAVLNALNKQNKSAIYAFVGEAVEIVCIFFLVALPGLRIYGCIIGFMLSALIVLLLQFVTVYKVAKLTIQWNEWFIKPILASLLMASISKLVYIFLYNGGFTLAVAFFISVLIGFFTCVLILYIVGSLPFVIGQIRSYF